MGVLLFLTQMAGPISPVGSGKVTGNNCSDLLDGMNRWVSFYLFRDFDVSYKYKPKLFPLFPYISV